MSLQIGIVGLPNVGKSTLFKALTKKQVDIANYPFCTIDPNVGVVEVPDERLAVLAKMSASAKIIPTTIEFVDIAGLVKGASLGEGLGNKFLANIREVDAIIQVLRDFQDPNIIHVHNQIDPDNDRQVINLELILADLQTIQKKLDTGLKSAQVHKDTKALIYFDLLQKVKAHLEQEQLANSLALTSDELAQIADLHLLTLKPQIYVYNISEDQLATLPTPKPNLVYLSAKLEAELVELEPEEAKNMLADLGLPESGLDKLIKASYQLLNLITFITTGPMETRAWTVTQGAKAPQAAGVIHTDFEQGFIRAEVISYNDFVKAGGEVGAKENGTFRIEGKDYIMQDGDICHFRFA